MKTTGGLPDWFARETRSATPPRAYPARQNPRVELSPQDSLILVGVIAAAVALLATAETLRVPYPILLVLGGLALALIPGMPTITLDPRLVLVAILPPLLYAGAYFTSLREVRANIAEISLLPDGGNIDCRARRAPAAPRRDHRR